MGWVALLADGASIWWEGVECWRQTVLRSFFVRHALTVVFCRCLSAVVNQCVQPGSLYNSFHLADGAAFKVPVDGALQLYIDHCEVQGHCGV